ncbi:MAG: vitamin K epoxide reductase family protein [Patescibacteria group bacterium]
MKMRSALVVVLVVAIGGIIFSGYLSYYNLWGPGCSEAIISCGPKPIEIFGLPQCIYGFFMYAIVAVLSVAAMAKNNSRAVTKWILGISIFGLLFAGFLAVYELFFQTAASVGVPACVYGFFLYLLAVIFASVGLRHKDETIQPVAQ